MRPPSLKLHLRTIRRSTRIIARSFNQLELRLRRAERQATRAAAPVRRKLTITPKRRAQLKLQGQYMGTIRGLKPAQKAKVKAVKERRGIESAIKVARRLAAR
jgi:hypothetical protein